MCWVYACMKWSLLCMQVVGSREGCIKKCDDG
jgi:hypothetical protein